MWLLVEKAKSLTKGHVDLALGACSHAAKADSCSPAARLVDVSYQASIFVPQVGSFSFAGHWKSPLGGTNPRITLADSAALCDYSPQNRRRKGWISRDLSRIGEIRRDNAKVLCGCK